MIDHRQIEAGEVEQLGNRGVGHQLLEVGRRVVAGLKLHQMRVAVAGGKLHQAQPIAMRIEAHRLGIDGDRRTEFDPVGEIAAMKMIGHAAPGGGAQEKTRTSTTLLPQVPETCASTNSATWAIPRKTGTGRR
jgi:hypothetical protein